MIPGMKKRENQTQEIFARLILEDGTEVYRDGKGRYRDVVSGRFLRKQDVEKRLRETPGKISPMQAARNGILDAVCKLDRPVQTVEEAWARLIEIQTEIALDIEQGSKATTALKFLGAISGLDIVEENLEQARLELIDPQSARLLLELIEEIQEEQDHQPDDRC